MKLRLEARPEPSRVALWMAPLLATFARPGWAPLAAAPFGLAAPTMFLFNRRTARMKKFEEMFREHPERFAPV